MNASASARVVPLLVLPTALGVMGAFLWTVGLGVRAQIPAVKFDVRATKGLVVTPVYEGWYEVDGRTYVLFGYYNRNLEEIVDVPIGPQNQLTPGSPDQGQPTRFFPGLYYGVFAVVLPQDQPKTEVTWTLTANGQTQTIPAILDPLYVISPQREHGTEHPGNTPPLVRLDPSGASVQGPHGIRISKTAEVSRPLALDVWVSDDGLPPAGQPAGSAGVRASLAGVPWLGRSHVRQRDAAARAGKSQYDGDLQRAGPLPTARPGD